MRLSVRSLLRMCFLWFFWAHIGQLGNGPIFGRMTLLNHCELFGGAEGDRTPDLRIANGLEASLHALSFNVMQ